MINKDIWELLKQEYSEFPQSKCHNANNKEIELAEKELQVKFSESYKYFLKNHEVNGCGPFNFYTLTKAPDSPTGLWSLIDATKYFKREEKWADIEDWYIVANDGSGNPIGVKPNGEVWISYHDANFEQEKLAENFESFIYKLLTNTL